MTHPDFLIRCTPEQQDALRATWQKWGEPQGEPWPDFMGRATYPTELCPWVGVWVYYDPPPYDETGPRMYLGIEPDGHTHS